MRSKLNYRELFKRFAQVGEIFNDAWIKKINRKLSTEGHLVGRQELGSGEVGTGARKRDVYQFRGVFISKDGVRQYGPYESFTEAAEAVGLYKATDVTTSIFVDRSKAKLSDDEQTAAFENLTRKEINYRHLFKRFSKRGEVFDDDWIDKMDETLYTKGVLVGAHEWDSGGPGAGAGSDRVRKFRGQFYSFDDVGNYGPYESFNEAAEAIGFFIVTDATTGIWVDPIKAKLNKRERTVVLQAVDATERLIALQQRKGAAEEP